MVGTVTRRIRAKVDYLAFVGAREWPVLVSLAGVALGVVAFVPTAVTLVISVVAFVLGLLTLWRDAHSLRTRWSGYRFTTIIAPFPLDEIPAPKTYPDAKYLVFPNRGTALVSDAMDKWVAENEIQFTVADEPYRLPVDLKATAPHVLPVMTRGRVVFNGHIVGMHGEPLPAIGRNPAPIRLHRARFFDGVCSNELGTLRITSKNNGKVYDLRREELVDDSGQLRTLSSSNLADLVGISTIAMTNDGKLVVVEQSGRNSASPLLLAPSGSGSFEPKDLYTGSGGRHGSLQAAIKAAMERELSEETGISNAKILRTRVIGFARWMERGAKPEFFGLTTLSIDSAAATSGDGIHGVEHLYSDGLQVFDLDLVALGQELASGGALLESPSLPVELRDVASLPLLLNIRAAALWLQDNKTGLA
jgi:hypothetical protein